MSAVKKILRGYAGEETDRLIAFCFFFNDTATTEIYTLSLHEAKAISIPGTKWWMCRPPRRTFPNGHQPPRIPAVESLISANARTNPESRLKSTVSWPGV